MASSTIKANDANIVHSATLASGVTGFVSYVQDGCTVTVTGVVSCSSAKAAGATLATGLPKPIGSWTIGNIDTFYSGTVLRIADVGALVTVNSISAGTSNIRFAYSYICS